MRGGDGQLQKTRRRGYLRFDKVRLLFAPAVIVVSHEPRATIDDVLGTEPLPAFAVRYGPKPEHLVRHYITLERATERARALAEKFGCKLVVEAP